jgi:thiol:disulfide interchange protein DsbD
LRNGHITAPTGKGEHLAPTFEWQNASVLRVIWPNSIDLPPDGSFKGYDSDFSVFFRVIANDVSKPITANLFYVVCDDSCRPINETISIDYNAKLTEEEVLNSQEQMSFWFVLLLAFVGGMILNCMPCVFPVLCLKIFSILKNKDKAKDDCLKFTYGVITTFLIIGWTLFYLRKLGMSVGWGFYMQNPIFVLSMSLLFLLSALYFFKVFAIRIPSLAIASGNAFINGAITGISSGICVGPFVGVAIGAALMYDDLVLATCVLVSLGLGVAFPFAIICLFPSIQKFIPKPGKWIETFKEFMGFAMLFSCLWCLWILLGMVSPQKFMVVMYLLLAFSVFVWIFEKKAKVLSVCGCLASVFLMCQQLRTEVLSKIEWTKFSFEELKQTERPIFLNFTASWCMTCGLNEVIFSKDEVADLFKKHNVLAIKADWTKRDSSISGMLSTFGVNSVPFYVYYKPNSKNPVILPTILTVNTLQEVIGK